MDSNELKQKGKLLRGMWWGANRMEGEAELVIKGKEPERPLGSRE